ncbi:MAG TPA: GNVR domain-containing protein [Longimicrobiales bacterium]|nr:GNVR domain-containing protein [Longimicrobiales bacterium]
MTTTDTEVSPGVVETWTRVVRRRWAAGLVVFVLVTGLAAALVFLSRPIWRAEAALRLGAPPALGGMPLGGGNTSSPLGLFSLFQTMTGDPFANELELLQSRTVVEGVVQENALNVALVAPRGWYRDSLFARLAASRETGKATYEATWLPSGAVRVRRLSPSERVVGDFAPGRDAAFGGIVVAFKEWRAGAPRVVKLKTYPFGDAVRRQGPRIRAERKRREANLVRIAYDDPDPALAQAVVASASTRYLALRTALQRRESGETVDSLRTVVEHTKAELARAETGLEGFQRASRLVDPQAQSEAFVKRQAEIATGLGKARAELAAVDEVIRRVEGVPDPAAAWAGLVAHPTFLENETLGGLLENLTHLEQQRIELAGRRTEADRQLQALDKQIAYLDGSLRSLVREYRAGIAEQVAQLEAQWREMDSALARAPAAAIELGRRQRDLRLLSEVYLFTDQRLRQEALKTAVSFSTVQMVDAPEVLFKPVWPRKKLGLAVGLMLAVAFGALAMALGERADRSVRSAGELRRLVDAPVLAALAPGADGRLALSAAERRALLQRAAAAGRGLVLAPLGEAAVAAEGVAHALVEAPAPEPVPARMADGAAGLPAVSPRLPVEVAPAVHRFAAAAELAEAGDAGAAVVLVARQGVTRREEAARAAALLREAGAVVAGAVLVCPSARALGDAWS